MLLKNVRSFRLPGSKALFRESRLLKAANIPARFCPPRQFFGWTVSFYPFSRFPPPMAIPWFGRTEGVIGHNTKSPLVEGAGAPYPIIMGRNGPKPRPGYIKSFRRTVQLLQSQLPERGSGGKQENAFSGLFWQTGPDTVFGVPPRIPLFSSILNRKQRPPAGLKGVFSFCRATTKNLPFHKPTAIQSAMPGIPNGDV